MSGVQLRAVLAQIRGGHGGPRHLQGSLHDADIQETGASEVDALPSRYSPISHPLCCT